MSLILWVDLEMTGLNVEKERIIEVAALVTDWNFSVKDQYHSVVYQSPNLLQTMDAWNTEHHTKSGLLSKISTAPSESQVESEISQMIKKHFNEPALLAGNSIAQDRLFISRYMPQLNSLLHYRMLDVSSWKVVFQNKFKKKYEKKGQHRALNDIHESIAELKFYLEHISTQS